MFQLITIAVMALAAALPLARVIKGRTGALLASAALGAGYGALVYRPFVDVSAGGIEHAAGIMSGMFITMMTTGLVMMLLALKSQRAGARRAAEETE